MLLLFKRSCGMVKYGGSESPALKPYCINGSLMGKNKEKTQKREIKTTGGC